ncbi:NUDIX hydrolase [Lutimaribacter marinistellae]|uniref:NUDIX hydrolase n=1 Tax=Lutimaribacter marinistellae TaxID=1820329 RepID=A0ABV7TFJ2_9RHOB
MIRRFGDRPRADLRYRLRAGAYALLPRDGKLLLTCQMSPDPDLQLPGGGIDPDESAVVALHREVYEETGWRIASPRRLGAFRRFVYMPEYDLWAEKVCTIFIARPVFRLGDPVETDHEAVWMSPDAAVNRLGNAGDRWFAGRYASSFTPNSKKVAETSSSIP